MRFDDGHEYSPEELYAYLTRVMYNRRATEMDLPLSVLPIGLTVPP